MTVRGAWAVWPAGAQPRAHRGVGWVGGWGGGAGKFVAVGVNTGGILSNGAAGLVGGEARGGAAAAA